ncbi:hypothetical protein AURDEDRAFT_187019, partial [Auricularia subglabra TFB-10046 SS5]
MSSTANPDDLLSHVMVLMIQYLTAVLAQSVLYGIFLLAFGVAFYNYIRKRRKTRLAIPFSAITLLTFGLSTCIWASNVSLIVKWFDIAFNSATSMQTRLELSDTSTTTLRYMSDVLFVLSYLIGDAVIAWRIVVLSQRSISTSVILASLWFGSLATGLALIGCLLKADFEPSPRLLHICIRLENSSWVLSLVFNALATLFLA